MGAKPSWGWFHPGSIRRTFSRRQQGVKVVDIEMQQEEEGKDRLDSTSISQHMSDFLAAYFCLTQAQLNEFRGIGAYCRHLEIQFLPLLESPYSTALWTSDDPPLDGNNAGSCWRLLHAVTVALTEAEEDASIEDLCNQAMAVVSGKTINPQSRPLGKGSLDPHAKIAVFAAVCWMTMLLRPSLDFQAPDNPPALACISRNLAGRPVSHKQHLTEARRPVYRLYSIFKGHIWDDQEVQPGTTPDHAETDASSDDNLYEGSLTFFALQQFGRITIEWVDTLGEHLKFDPAGRRLYLFRFPTFCVLSSMRGHEWPVLKSIAEHVAGCHPQENSYASYVTLEQEVLLSYRLLFAQNSRSRALARTLLQGLEQADEQRSFDSLLRTLMCDKKSQVDRLLPHEIWPVWCRDASTNLLQENEVYSARSDFPRLGHRLVYLQRFSLRHTPSRLTDLWMDRRNVLQWYTFWAVVLVGGTATLLSVVQVVLQGISLNAGGS